MRAEGAKKTSAAGRRSRDRALKLKHQPTLSLLTEFPVVDLWLKALLPMNRSKVARVQVLLQWLKSELRAESEAGLGAQH